MASIHGTCILIGAEGVLIRGASGAGKTRLALALIEEGRRRGRLARLVTDDRVVLVARHGRIIARAPLPIAGLVERRGLAVTPIDHEPAAVLCLIVDIVAAAKFTRLPGPEERRTLIQGILLERLAVPADPALAAPLIYAALSLEGHGAGNQAEA